MLELSNTSLIVLKRENCILKSRGASLLLLVLLDEAAASEASLHKRYLKMATFKTLQMILFFFFVLLLTVKEVHFTAKTEVQQCTV